MIELPTEFREQVLAAAARPDVVKAIGEVYRDLQREIDARKPICVVSGRCCRFEEYGHRLFVTTVEMAAFYRSCEPASGPWDGRGCPFQSRGLCGVHAIRPFGCRIF